MKSAILKTLVIACALSLCAPLGARGKEGRQRGGDPALDAALAKVVLDDKQKARIQEIKDKYHGEFQSFQKAHKEELAAAKQAKDRKKARQIMQPLEQKREALIGEIKAVLTEEQKTQLQQALDAARAAGHGKRGGKRGADK
jgi:hypothetical protein